MGGDTVFVNNRSKKENSFDAIVIGSGITGGWAAKELCEKGLRVLMLERGETVRHPDYPTATKDPWDFQHRLKLSKEDRETHPIQSRHWSFREDNKHFYIKDLENPYMESKRFDWIRGNVVGGRSLLWSRACYRWSDLDFEANLKDGHGVDWPIRYKDIAPWYDYVESFIGVSGSREGIAHLPDGLFQPPFELNSGENFFKGVIESKYPDHKLIIGRTANLTRPVAGRGQCQARDLCHRGCPYGAYFSTNSSTMPAAFATGRLTLRPDTLVNRIIYDEEKKLARGVEVLDLETLKTYEFYSSLLFINASTVASAFILLNSACRAFPNGLGNGSDQVGRNLMDHHKGLSASGELEGLKDWYYYGRRPVPAYIPRFRNLYRQEANFLRGYHFGASAARHFDGGDSGIGASLKDVHCEPGPWEISLYAFGECLPYKENRVALSKDKKNRWGQPLIQVDCEFKENEHKMHEDMGIHAREMLEAAGLRNIRVSNPISFPGNANHEMGTARMGRDPGSSVLNAFNQMHEVKNVFITDGSCMTSSNCVNPSLTYMALTARACDYAVRELKKGNI
jgi:choline dehydrogenase-like flavoprotein